MDLLLQHALLYLGYIQATHQNFNDFLSLTAQKRTLNLQVKTDKKKGGGTHTQSFFQLLSDIVSSGSILDKLATSTLIVLQIVDSSNNQKK